MSSIPLICKVYFNVAPRKKHESEIHTKFEGVNIWYEEPSTGYKVMILFEHTGIPIIPHSWYHVCLGLDTVSGFLRIVVNGIKVVDEEREEFRNTTAWRPESLEGKIVIFKQYCSGFWLQHRGKFTNMNIFSSMIPLKDMMMMTSGEDDCMHAGDYLSWDEMEWSVSGDVDSDTVDKEKLCQRLGII